MISESNIKFDFIYIDCSHALFNSYTDLILSFNLLNKGGVLGINDYTFNKDIVFESRFLGVNYFLEKFKDKLIVIEKDNRVFIEKI